MNAMKTTTEPRAITQRDNTQEFIAPEVNIFETKDGYVLLLMNNRGVDKTQNGVARVDRRQFVEVAVQTKLPVKSAREFTGPRDLAPTTANGTTTIRVTVHPGDVQVIGLVTGR